MRNYLKQGLPHYKHGKILVKRSEFDAWFRQFRIEKHELDEYVDQVLADLKESNSQERRTANLKPLETAALNSKGH